MTWCWYFAYGSNMQGATFRGRRGIAPRRAVAVRAAGWRLVFDKPPLFPLGHTFANVVPDPTAATYGVAWEISVDDLAHVEFTEGVQLGNYERAALTVETLAGEVLVAVTLTSSKRTTDLAPSTRYMGLLIEGALEHGLPDAWVARLRAVPAVEESAAARAARGLLDGVMKKKGAP